jgi:acetyl esterase/lipase
MEQKKARFRITKSEARKVEAEEKRLALMMRALKAVHTAGSAESMAPEDLERQRAGQELLGRLVTPMIGMRWEPFDLQGMKAAWVRLEWGHDRHKVILYCHGGGYTSGNLGYSRPLSSKLSQATGWETLCFEYRLAPEHPYPAAVEDALKVWDYLMYQGYGARDVTVVGDSAGGNLALVLLHRLKAAGRQLPGHLVLLSPWTDMTASGASYTQRAQLDPSITKEYIYAVRKAYAGNEPLDSPMLSPLFGDFTGFPPTLIQVGSCELLYSDAEQLQKRMAKAGVFCRLEEWAEMWHVFQMYPIKRAGEAMDHIGAFLQR